MYKIDPDNFILNPFNPQNLNEQALILDYQNIAASILSALNGRTLTEHQMLNIFKASTLYGSVTHEQLQHCLRSLYKNNRIKPVMQEYKSSNKYQTLWGLLS